MVRLISALLVLVIDPVAVLLTLAAARRVPVHGGFDGLASSTGDRWNQSAPLDPMADCRDEYIDPMGRCTSDC
jgi:hypothetical protein